MARFLKPLIMNVFVRANTRSWSQLTHPCSTPASVVSNFMRGFQPETSTCRLSSPKFNITYANWRSNSASSFQVACALSMEFWISSISSQRMTVVQPLCVGGCQPLSSPGILQTGQTCGCCFARSFSVFGCRLYAEHRQLAGSHTRARRSRCSTPYSTLGTLAGRELVGNARKRKEKEERRKRATSKRGKLSIKCALVQK